MSDGLERNHFRKDKFWIWVHWPWVFEIYVVNNVELFIQMPYRKHLEEIGVFVTEREVMLLLKYLGCPYLISIILKSSWVGHDLSYWCRYTCSLWCEIMCRTAWGYIHILKFYTDEVFSQKNIADTNNHTIKDYFSATAIVQLNWIFLEISNWQIKYSSELKNVLVALILQYCRDSKKT